MSTIKKSSRKKLEQKKESRKKNQRWIVTVAWPYLNSLPHLGNLIGSILSGDVFARYVRLKGDEVVFVSGSDTHGTPTVISAMEHKTTPEKLTEINHAKIAQLFRDWQISFDNYTHTHNPVHIQFTQEFYKRIEQNGYTTIREEEAMFCENDKLFLPDRFIEGICPYCGSERARGDQCDACGKLLDPILLKEPRCKHCKKTPIMVKTKHWYFDFARVEGEIRAFVENNPYISANARTLALSYLTEGLPSRAITRDLAWGIPAPFEGAEGKSIYVWFEAVLGYISAVKQWAIEIKHDPTLFDKFWRDPNTKSVYFIGKDNIIFHLIIFPGLIAAYNKNLPPSEQFTMPYNVSSTEFLNYENDKFSKSRGIGIWIDEALELAPVEYWRFSLLRNRPEKQDTNFLWTQFEKDILELNDIIGNFVHRTQTFIYRNFDQKIPAPPPETALDAEDRQLLQTIQNASKQIGDLFDKFHLKDALNEIITIARQGNIYINNKAPWKLLKTDKLSAGYTFNLAAQLVRCLAILLFPFIPNVSEKMFHLLGIDEIFDKITWVAASDLKLASQIVIPNPEPLFLKLDITAMQAKLNEMHGNPQTATKETPSKTEIDYTTFEKCDFRVGTIIDAEAIPENVSLVKLLVDVGLSTGPLTIVAGIAKNYTPDELTGSQIVVLVNLVPKEINGILSQGMLLAVDLKKLGAALLRPNTSVPNGSKVR